MQLLTSRVEAGLLLTHWAKVLSGAVSEVEKNKGQLECQSGPPQAEPLELTGFLALQWRSTLQSRGKGTTSSEFPGVSGRNAD